MTWWILAYLDEAGDVVLVEILRWVVKNVVNAIEVDVLATELQGIGDGSL